MSTTTTAPAIEAAPPRTLRPRHIVERRNGRPLDRCLCGYLWDVYPIAYDEGAGICAECVAELRRRGGGAAS